MSVMIKRENPRNAITFNVSAYDTVSYKELERFDGLSKEESDVKIKDLEEKYNKDGYVDFSYWGIIYE